MMKVSKQDIKRMAQVVASNTYQDLIGSTNVDRVGGQENFPSRGRWLRALAAAVFTGARGADYRSRLYFAGGLILLDTGGLLAHPKDGGHKFMKQLSLSSLSSLSSLYWLAVEGCD